MDPRWPDEEGESRDDGIVMKPYCYHCEPGRRKCIVEFDMEKMYQSGATFYQTPSLSVLSQCGIPPWCITNAISVDTHIVLAWGPSSACTSPLTERLCAPEGGYLPEPLPGVMPTLAEGDLLHPVHPATALQDAIKEEADASTAMEIEVPPENSEGTQVTRMEVTPEEYIVMDTKQEIYETGSVGPVVDDPYKWEQDVDWGDEVEDVAVPVTAFEKHGQWKDKVLPVDEKKPDLPLDLYEPQVLVCPWCHSNFGHYHIWCPSCRKMVIQDTQHINEYILERMRAEVETIAQRELHGLEYASNTKIGVAHPKIVYT